MRQGSFFPDCRLPVQSLLRSPYSPRLHSHASKSICAHVKNPKHWQPCHCFDTRKYCSHLSERVTLLLRLLCFTQVRGLECPPPKGQWRTMKGKRHTHKETVPTCCSAVCQLFQSRCALFITFHEFKPLALIPVPVAVSKESATETTCASIVSPKQGTIFGCKSFSPAARTWLFNARTTRRTQYRC